MRKHLFLLFCLLLLSGGLFAQNIEPDKNKNTIEVTPIIHESDGNEAENLSAVMAAETEPSEPNYMAPLTPMEQPVLEKIAKTSVDYYTGTANVYVPLYTISSYGINIPIGLNYSAKGIKLFDSPSWCGSNWKMTGGGSIKRVLMGMPDETGWLAGHGASAATAGNFDDKIKNKFDGQPDFYHFELPTGETGGFVINYDKSIALIPYQDIKIQWVNNTIYNDSYFVITNAQGLKFYFGTSQAYKEQGEFTIEEKPNTYATTEYISGWMLEYVSYGDKEIARYTYTSGGVDYGYPQEKYIYEVTPWKYFPGTNYQDFLNLVWPRSDYYPRRPKNTTKVLKSITWGLGKLEFTHSPAVNGSGSSRMDIYAYNNEYVKTICFDKSMLKGDSRNLLDRIYEKHENQKREICSFQYYDNQESITRLGNRYPDNLGHPSPDSRNSTPGVLDILNMRKPGWPDPSLSTIPWVKKPDFTHTRKGSLERIIYPTGGWTEFDYELHKGRLHDKLNAPEETVGGLRIKSIGHFEKDGSILGKTQYVYDDPSSSGTKGGRILSDFKPFPRILKDTAPNSNFNDKNRVITYSATIYPDFPMTDFTGSPVVYNYVKEILPNGSYNTYEYTVNMDPRGKFTSSPTGPYVDDTMFYMVPSSTTFHKRGLLTSMKQYTSSNQEIYRETYTYAEGPIKSIYSYVFFNAMPQGGQSLSDYKGRYEWISQPVVLSGKTTSGLYQSPVTTTYSYHSNYDDLFPRTIIESDNRGNQYKTSITYPQDYSTNMNYPAADSYGIAWMKENGVKSVPIETIKSRKDADKTDYNILGGTINLYKWNTVAGMPVLEQTKSLLINTLSPSITHASISTTGSSLVIDSRYDEYNPQAVKFNNKGNPEFITFTGNWGYGTRIIYGYDGHIPVARINNITYGEGGFYTSFEEHETSNTVFWGDQAKTGDYVLAKNTPFEVNAGTSGNYVISYWKRAEKSLGEWKEVRTIFTGQTYRILEPNYYVDEVRVMPGVSSMTTEVVKPGIGVISKADEKGATTRYNYNPFGMLESIARHDGQVVEKYAYIDTSAVYNLSAGGDSGFISRGTVSVSPAQVSPGGSATFTVTPNPGYDFSGWQFSDGTTAGASSVVKSNIQSDLHGAAFFSKQSHNLTAVLHPSYLGGGTVSVSSSRVFTEESATWTATPNSGYAFDRWVFSDGTTSMSATTTKTGIFQAITGQAIFVVVGPQPVNFYANIMPRNGYWAINIGCTPDIISEGVKVYVTGYFFINPYEPNEDVVPFNGEVNEEGYLITDKPFDETITVGKLSGTISISGSDYKVGTVSWN